MPYNAALFLRAQTAVHAGAGTSIGVIDLPIQRERHTQWPTVQGSSIKGVLRDAFRRYLIDTGALTDDEQPKQIVSRREADRKGSLQTIFGPATNDGEYAGALSVTDARLLGFPVRSARGVFAIVTCYSVLKRLEADLQMAGLSFGNQLALNAELALKDDQIVASDEAFGALNVEQRVLLEDLIFNRDATHSGIAQKVGQWLTSVTGSATDRRFVIVSDNAFTYLAKHTTELATRIALDYDTKRVKQGALFVLELLPPETILYSLLLADKPRRENGLPQDQIIPQIKCALKDKLLQIGGEETTGKGWCRTTVYTGGQPKQ
jgi:CRISPR-associated protein Cmr4